MHTIAVSGSQLDVADSAIGPKNQQLSVVVTAGRLAAQIFTTLDKEVAPGRLDIAKRWKCSISPAKTRRPMTLK